jgi:ligand-binding sensor domain-containing protein/two-component sensor histidine kinase
MFENITSKEGLADRVVNTIIQDSQGFIWIGSGEGLTRYDGYSCVSYRHRTDNPYSISDNEINAMCVDNEGALWIGTSNGLNKYDAGNDRFERFLHDSSNYNSLSANEVSTITKDPGGNLWIGTFGGGLTQMIKKKHKPVSKSGEYHFIHYKHKNSDSNSISSNQVLSHCVDKDGNSWIGTPNGLNLLHVGTKKFTRFYNRMNNTNSIINSTVHRIFIDKDNRIWISGKAMLDRLTWHSNVSSDSITVEHLLPSLVGNTKAHEWVINDFITDRQGNAWIASNDHGLVRFDLKQRLRTNAFERFVSSPQMPNSLASSNAYCLFEDRSGVIWIGTSKGVSKFIPSKTKFNELQIWNGPQPSRSFVMAVLSDKAGRLWLAYDSDTLFVVQVNSDHSSSLRAISLAEGGGTVGQVNVLYKSNAGDIYVGTLLQGLFIIPGTLKEINDKKKWIRITSEYYADLPSNNIYSIAEDSAGVIYIGTYRGLCLYDPGRKQLELIDPSPTPAIVPGHIIRSVSIDKNGKIWCGTDNGVRLLHGGKLTNVFRNIEADSTSLSHNKTTSCYIDRNSNIWIGTKSGLNLYNPRKNYFKRFISENDLPDPGIRSLIQDNGGNLWIATNHGLAKYDVNEKRFYNYGMEDGLISDQFITNAVHRDSLGVLYFGTNNGLVSFKPENIRPNSYVPPVAITNIRIFNTPIWSMNDTNLVNTYKRENHLVLSYDQNFFSFEFAGLNYINSAANQYAYKLEGIDKEWVYPGTQRFAGYTDIPPGRYIFNVKASNNDNIWNDIPATITITIIPPWWKTWWFYALCFIAACALAYSIYRIRLQQVLKLYKLRSNIAKDLHDDVGSALSSIALLSSIARDRKTNASLKPEEIISRIGDTSKQMIDLMDDIVWSVNPANDRFENMLIRMREYAVEMLEARNISFDFNVAQNVDDLKIPMQLRKDYFLIFKEALNNLTKYSRCTRATIMIKHNNQSIITIVSDNGNGFDPKSIHSGNGLRNMQERAKALKAKLEIETEQGKGTRITFIVPVT